MLESPASVITLSPLTEYLMNLLKKMVILAMFFSVASSADTVVMKSLPADVCFQLPVTRSRECVLCSVDSWMLVIDTS